jgi:hypothetical protein
MAYFKIYSYHLSRETEENHEKILKSKQQVSMLRLENRTFQIQSPTKLLHTIQHPTRTEPKAFKLRSWCQTLYTAAWI